MIKAIHPATGRHGNFSNEAWELLPEGKDGWKIQVPEEVAEAIDKKGAKGADKKGAKGKKIEETAGEGDPAAEEETAGEGDPAAEEETL